MTRDKHGRLTRTTFRYGGAEVTLVYEDDRIAMLVGLFSKNRGQGDAKAVMIDAMDHVDKHGISVWLEAKRYGDWRNSLDNDQLVHFYGRFGFDLVAGQKPQHHMMTREPLLKGD